MVPEASNASGTFVSRSEVFILNECDPEIPRMVNTLATATRIDGGI